MSRPSLALSPYLASTTWVRSQRSIQLVYTPTCFTGLFRVITQSRSSMDIVGGVWALLFSLPWLDDLACYLHSLPIHPLFSSVHFILTAYALRKEPGKTLWSLIIIGCEFYPVSTRTRFATYKWLWRPSSYEQGAKILLRIIISDKIS